jgi:hypothetical protein
MHTSCQIVVTICFCQRNASDVARYVKAGSAVLPSLRAVTQVEQERNINTLCRDVLNSADKVMIGPTGHRQYLNM